MEQIHGSFSRNWPAGYHRVPFWLYSDPAVLVAFRAIGAEIFRPYFLALVAEAHSVAGQAEEGMAVLAEALEAYYRLRRRTCYAGGVGSGGDGGLGGGIGSGGRGGRGGTGSGGEGG